MGKKKNLNGLANSLVQSYFSTLCYYDRGYMPCWIWKQASELGITELEIDILNKTTTPAEMSSKPILAYLDKLEAIISKTLASNQFEQDFFTEAKLVIEINMLDATLNQVSCQGVLKDKEGKIYKGKIIKDTAYPIADTMFEKIKKLLN